MKEKTLKALINDFINDDLVNELLSPTIFEIYAKKNDEDAHSSFLGTLFDAKNNGGYGDVPLKKLLKLIYDNRKDQLNDISESNILLENYELSNIKSENWFRLDAKDDIDDKGNKFLDLKIDFTYLGDKKIDYSIIIENKINHEEGFRQTQTYYKRVQKLQPKKKNIYVYLTPSKRKNEPKCKEFIPITYGDLFGYIIEPLSRNNYKKTYLYNNLVDYKRLLLKMGNIEFEEDYINKIELKSKYEKLFNLQVDSMGEEEKILFANFETSPYGDIYNMLDVKRRKNYYDFDDLGFTVETRLYFSPIKKRDLASGFLSKEDMKDKYIIYPTDKKGLSLNYQMTFDSSTKLVEYLFEKENVENDVANAKSNLYYCCDNKYYSITQYREKMLNDIDE